MKTDTQTQTPVNEVQTYLIVDKKSVSLSLNNAVTTQWLSFKKVDGVTTVFAKAEKTALTIATLNDIVEASHGVSLSEELSLFLNEFLTEDLAVEKSAGTLDKIGKSNDIIDAEKVKIIANEETLITDFFELYNRALKSDVGYTPLTTSNILSKLFIEVSELKITAHSKSKLGVYLDTLKGAFVTLNLAGKVNSKFIKYGELKSLVAYDKFIASSGYTKLKSITDDKSYHEFISNMIFRGKFLAELNGFFEKKDIILGSHKNPLTFKDDRVVFAGLDIAKAYSTYNAIKQLNTVVPTF